MAEPTVRRHMKRIGDARRPVTRRVKPARLVKRMRYTVEIVIRNSGTGPFTLQVGEINGEGTIPGYERACELVNRRLDALPSAEIIGGRIVADDGSVVAMLRSGRVRYVGLANWYSIK